MKFANSTSLVLVGGSLLLAGCETPRHTYYGPNGQVISSRSERAAADVALESSVQADLNRYGDLARVAQNVRAHAANGTVTLTGSVPTEKDRQMIDAMVRNTAGVVAVNDEIQVGYPPTGPYGQPPVVYTGPTPPVVVVPGPGPEIQTPTASDRRLADDVLARFRANSIPPSWTENVVVLVTNGDVYLRGYVNDAQQRRAIVSSVEHTPGVRTIYDQLVVR